MVRVLIDTDVILDFLLERPEFINDAERIWQAQVDEEFEGYISAITPINVFLHRTEIKRRKHSTGSSDSFTGSLEYLPVK